MKEKRCIVNSSNKAYISLLMSVFLMSSVAALVYIGVFDFKNFPSMPAFVKVIAIIAVFSALFLLFVFLINVKPRPSGKKKTAAVDPAGISPAEVTSVNVTPIDITPASVTPHQGGLLAAASLLSPPAGINEISRLDVIYEKNGIPYINSCLANENTREKLDSNFIKLVESVTGCLPPPVSGQQNKPEKAHKGSQG